MSDLAFLALLLDGPMQSWGSASRFQRRTTGLHPTKSGVIGMVSAAMGLAKGSPEEAEWLPKLSLLKMTSIVLRRKNISRLEDFHTTGGGYDKKTHPQFTARKASGGPSDNATVSRREYLLEARFGIIFEGDRHVLERAAAALDDPIWGVWFGRKSCIPAELIFPRIFNNRLEAERALIGDAPIEQFTRLEESTSFDAGTDSYNDQPISFGTSDSSADGRDYTVRRVNLIIGKIQDA